MTEHFDEEWGPWHDHDGLGCPVRAGTIVHYVIGETDNGDSPEDYEWTEDAGRPLNAWEWIGPADPTDKGWTWGHDKVFPIIYYRVKKPLGLQMLERLLQNLPTDAKEDVAA